MDSCIKRGETYIRDKVFRVIKFSGRADSGRFKSLKHLVRNYCLESQQCNGSDMKLYDQIFDQDVFPYLLSSYTDILGNAKGRHW